MSNALYDKYRQSLDSYADAGLSAPVDLKNDTIKVALVTAGYTANMSTDQFYSSVSANAVGAPQSITYTSGTAGVWKSSATITVPSVTGSQVTQLVIYKDTGTASTSPLICRIDTATGLPVTPNGGNITITWDATNGIFKP